MLPDFLRMSAADREVRMTLSRNEFMSMEPA